MRELSRTTPIARKEHICNFCSGKIVKGEKYDRCTILFEGEIYDWKSHLECLELTKLLEMYGYYDEGVTEDEFKTYIDEYVKEEHFIRKSGEIEEGWKDISYYEKVKKIITEFEDKRKKKINDLWVN